MPQRTLISIFDHEGLHIQALVQSISRSFKMHVWAAPMDVDQANTTILKYIGTIQPIDQTDTFELEELVRGLYLNGRYT